MVTITNPQTLVLSLLLLVILLVTTKKRQENSAFSISATTEMKGLAILSIIFAHIAFGVAPDNRFLWPLSTWAGAGVNIFFFLSGFGLTVSAIS